MTIQYSSVMQQANCHLLPISLVIIVVVLAPVRASGQAMFSEGQPIEAPPLHDLAVVDFDSDGNPDLIAVTAEGEDAKALVWFKNNGAGGLAPAQTLLPSLPPETRTLKMADLNSDGTPDLLVGDDATFGSGGLFWAANDGGQFNSLEVIEPAESGPFIAVDFDGDGDLDVLQGGLYVGLYENTGRNGSRFRRAHALAPGPAEILAAGDFDGDGDADLISSHRSFERNNDLLFYYAQREPGRLRFSLEHELVSFVREQVVYNRLISDMSLADIDGDGRRDVVIGAFLNTDVGPDEGLLRWYKNRSFGDNPAFTIGGTIVYQEGGPSDLWGPRALTVGDFDGDGDSDIALAKSSHRPDTLVWYENPENEAERAATWSDHTVGIETSTILSLQAIDMDLDGDVDLISFSSTSDEGRIVWYENMGSTGTATEYSQGDATLVPESLTLEAMWSNPSYGVLNVAYQVMRAGRVRLEIFDVLGRAIGTYEEFPPHAGSHRAELDLSRLARGTYILRLSTGEDGDIAGQFILQ